MIGTIIVIAIVVAVVGGLWLTRRAGGWPLGAEGRAVDAKSHISPMGDPMSFDDDFKRPPGG